MRLIVPHPGHFAALKEIIEVKEAQGLQDVEEVYMAGSPAVMGSGRATLHAVHLEELQEQAAYAHEHHLKLNVVINPSCLGGAHLTYEGYTKFVWYFEELNKAGVDGVTVAEPYLIELLREFPMKRIISCIAHVESPQRAVFYEELGADVITVDTNINRNFKVLEAIREAVSCDLRILVNEGCLYKCPFRHAHFNLFSHITAARSSILNPQSQPINLFSDYYFDKCISIRVRDPSQIIRSPWIRPEDLKDYEALGIDEFKISGRANALNWIITCMAAYARRSFDGNLLDLLDCPSELRYLFFIHNHLLDGCLDRWKSCRKMCHECGYCTELAHTLVEVRKT